MNEKIELLKKLQIEDFIWIIYLVIIVLSFYSNYIERKYIIYDDPLAKKKYQNLIILIFTIAVFVYLYFFIDGYKDVKNLKCSDTLNRKIFRNLNFIASSLILVAGVIFLCIAIFDEELDVELAFS